MKNLLSTIIAVSVFSSSAFSQLCTPGNAIGKEGFYPHYDSIPCIEAGVPYSHTISFEIQENIAGIVVEWIRIDSINNLPPGISYNIIGGSQINGGQKMCIEFYGTTNASP